MSTRKEIVVTYLPLVLSCIAIGTTAYGEYRRSTEAKSSYNQSRIELFRQMTAQTKNKDEIMTIYGEVFPNDEKILRGERQSQK
jgi:hypothetical protein